MPKHLRIALTLFVAAVLAHGAFAPFHEAGIWRMVVPLFDLLIAGMAILFARRVQWTWGYLQWLAIFSVLFGVAFFPTAPPYGNGLLYLRALAVLEMVAGAIIAWSILRDAATRTWFRTSEQAAIQ